MAALVRPGRFRVRENSFAGANGKIARSLITVQECARLAVRTFSVESEKIADRSVSSCR